MIDVTAPVGLFPEDDHAALARALGEALLRAEGAPLQSPFVEHTGVFLHVLPADAVHTVAAPSAPVVRVEVLTPSGALTRDGQRQLVAEATGLVARFGGDPTLAARTWVLLSEAAEGGWGVFGTALGAEDFAALRASRT